MRLLGKDEVASITLGAAVLATGGGGDPYLGSIMAIDAIEEYGPVKLVSVDEIGDDDLFVTVAMVGAPTVIMEKLPSGEEAVIACRAIEKNLGRKITGIYPIEAGGVNSLLPIAAAARLGLPIADMDGMGRAFPELQMTTFHLHGINFSPAAVVDVHSNCNLVLAKDAVWSERFARVVCAQMGGAAVVAACPLTGAQARSASIRDILTLEQRLGEAVTASRGDGQKVISGIREILGARMLFHGKVLEVDRRTEGAFNRGLARAEGLSSYKGKSFEVQFQNEYLVARVDGEVCCVTPDLITLLDDETGMPVLTERLRYGARIRAIGIPAHRHWRSPKGLEVAGPRYFRYEVDFTPVEELVTE